MILFWRSLKHWIMGIGNGMSVSIRSRRLRSIQSVLNFCSLVLFFLFFIQFPLTMYLCSSRRLVSMNYMLNYMLLLTSFLVVFIFLCKLAVRLCSVIVLLLLLLLFLIFPLWNISWWESVFLRLKSALIIITFQIFSVLMIFCITNKNAVGCNASVFFLFILSNIEVNVR